jgi:hypothetical protein
MMFPGLHSPAEAGFAKAGSPYPLRIKVDAGVSGIML